MARGKGPGHKTAMKTHATRRAAERHGLLTWPRAEVLAAIRARDPHRTAFLTRQSGTRSVWAVRIDHRWIPVVYHRGQGDVATVLPADWPGRHGYIILEASILGDAGTGD